MEQFLFNALEQAPTFLGLTVLAVVLYRQNNRLLDELFGRIENLERRLVELEKRISE